MAKKGNETNLLEDLFHAYYDARRNKRNTINTLAYEMAYESNNIMSDALTPQRLTLLKN